MILADKIIDERKKNNWSQEDLADKLGVSRQSVSKWESAQSIPDLQRILEMSKLFGVSTDYLLKDEEGDRGSFEAEDPGEIRRRVSMEEANDFLAANESFGKKVSRGVAIILSGVVLLLVAVALQSGNVIPVSENAAAGIGVVLLLLSVAAALAIIIPAGLAYSKWSWLGETPFETEYGVDGAVRARDERYQSTFVKSITIGVIIIMLGVMGIVGASLLSSNEGVQIGAVAVFMALVTIAVYLFVQAGVIKSGYARVLREGDYAPKGPKDRVVDTVTTVYWLLVTAGFFAWSFIWNAWDKSWLVWPIAGIGYAIIAAI
ncbi:MAG: helix-turn-helix transcriptional regulator, partial [Lachnospiraceae bacterium]|nr:helix-turn-helix transcriptional regulator [Lachnospiraceae bacterium]